MVSRVVFECDGPAHEGQLPPEGSTRMFVLPGMEPSECELCDDCMKDLTSPLYDTLEAVGRKIDGPVRTGRGRPPGVTAAPASPSTMGQYRCLDRVCTVAYASPQSMIGHYVRDHGVESGTPLMPPELDTCPLCGEPVSGVPALGQHVAGQHRDGEGARTAYEAIWIASREGDPHKIAAREIKHLNARGGNINAKGGR